MGATGESVRRITNFGFNPSWSPDGRQLVIAEEAVMDSPNDRTRFSKLSVVDAASRGNERDHHGSLSFETIRAQLLPGRGPSAGQQLLESSLDA